jgi:hypothetical protein
VSIRFAFLDSIGAYTDSTAFRPILLDPTNGSEDTGIDVITYAAGTVIGCARLTQGISVGAPTGGDKGTGTLNATNLYINGTALGTAALVNTGTSGATVPLLNAVNVFGAEQNFERNLHIYDVAENGKAVVLKSGSSTRWQFGIRGGSGEPGADAGNDFEILNYSDAGSILSFAARIQRSNGAVQVGSPTGGYKGAGTINAVGVYDNNTLLTCYVMAAEKGDLTLDKWDAATPDLHVPEQRHEKDGEVIVIPEVNETRIHEPARKFFARAEELLDPEKYAKAWKKDGHLPTMPSPAEWEESGKKMTLGALVQKLWETVEVQAVHIAKLEARISSLGG